jgi:hypothetical protein
MLTQLMEFNNTSVLIKHGDHVYPVLFRCLELAAPDLEVILPLAKSKLGEIIRKTVAGEYKCAPPDAVYAAKLLLPTLREMENFLNTQLVDTLNRLRHPTTLATKFVAEICYTKSHNEVIDVLNMWSRVVQLSGGHASNAQMTEAIMTMIMMLSKGVMVNLPATQCALDLLVKHISTNRVVWPEPRPVHVARHPTVLITPAESDECSLESFFKTHCNSKNITGVLKMGTHGNAGRPCRFDAASTLTVVVDETDVDSFSTAIKKTFHAVARLHACDMDLFAQQKGSTTRFFTSNASALAEANFELPGKPATEAFTGLLDVVMRDRCVAPGFVWANTEVVELGTNALVEPPKGSTCALPAGAHPRDQILILKMTEDPSGSLGTLLNLMVGADPKDSQKKSEQDAVGKTTTAKTTRPPRPTNV